VAERATDLETLARDTVTTSLALQHGCIIETLTP
jgi:hypothetical protein